VPEKSKAGWGVERSPMHQVGKVVATYRSAGRTGHT
jgi:hypothetical protein